MDVNDRSRLNLHRKLEEALGADEADTLMAHLPPVTWHDVATKSSTAADIGVVRADIDIVRADIAILRADMRTEISTAMERQIRWMVAFNTSLAVTVLGAARLLF